MIIIGDAIISDELFENEFTCNLKACKGACCIEGEMGAPLIEEEILILEKIYESVKPFLTPEGIAAIEENGKYVTDEMGARSTVLRKDGACAYIYFDENGTSLCGIEIANKAGFTDFLKPISCHLYPIRITKYADFEAVNYSRWSICSDACDLGKKLKMPVFRFLKTPIIRKFGEEFYEAMEQIYSQRDDTTSVED